MLARIVGVVGRGKVKKDAWRIGGVRRLWIEKRLGERWNVESRRGEVVEKDGLNCPRVN